MLSIFRPSRSAPSQGRADIALEALARAVGASVTTVAARAQINLGVALTQLDRHADALIAFDEVVTRLEDTSDPSCAGTSRPRSREKAWRFMQLERPAEALTRFDDVVAHFDAEPTLNFVINAALTAKALTLRQLERHAEALIANNTVLERIGEFTEPELQPVLAWASTARPAH